MANKARMMQILAVSSAGLGGLATGISFEKFNKSTSKCSVVKAASLQPPPVTSGVHTQLPDVVIPRDRTTQIMKFGFPGFDQVKSLDNYVLSYDRRNRTAHWVLEHFTYNDLKRKDIVDRTKCDFHEDLSVHHFFRSTNNDYKGSGYDRGHLAAAGNQRLDQKHCEQTFLLSNMAPQVGRGFNRDAWNKLEKYVRHLTKFYKQVYVCTGPLYLPRKEADGKTYVKYQVIGPNHVAVPTHFFKVVLAETEKQELELEAYVMPNTVIDEKTSIFSFQVPVESIERAAGLLFFEKIPRETFKRINGRKVTFI